MTTKPENVFKRKVMQRLKAIPDSYWMSIQQVGLRGHPDVVGCVKGQFIGLEFKKDVKETTKKGGREALQHYVLNKINQAQGFAIMIHPENADAIINTLRARR